MFRFWIRILRFLFNRPDNDEPPVPEPPPQQAEGILVLWIPGWFGSIANFSGLREFLIDKGYNPELLVSEGLSNLQRMCTDSHMNELDEIISRLLAETGKDKISLIGYSAGGGAVYNYMHFGSYRDKVENVVLMAGTANYRCSNYGDLNPDATPVTAKYTSIYSPQDGIVSVDWAHVEGANNVVIENVPHLSFIRDERVFEAVHEALQGGGLNQ